MLMDEALQRFTIGRLDDLGAHLVGHAVLCSGYDSLADRAAARMQLLVGMLVAFLPSHIGLIDLYWTVETPVIAIVGPCLAETVQHKPRRLLRDAEVTVKLHAGDAFKARQAEVDGDGPLA